ncbi:hypothetical protein N7G274_003044 [Stereocaulon virgatum]|uniref:N-acetyltransferase domain-containing protein n=1 Tax=Stereocaulon virgatum TaxID=373712 RepID=A0ABR4AES8_9LECA
MTPSLTQLRVADIDLLSEWVLTENVRALGNSIPGYRSSATFLTTLRSNLHLSTTDQSPYSSLVSTPTASAFTYTSQLAYPNPSPLSISSAIADSQQQQLQPASPIPSHTPSKPSRTLTHHILPPDTTTTPSLRLIATSINEQRYLAAKAFLTHQITIATLLLSTSILYKLTSPTLLLLLLASTTFLALTTLYIITLPYGHLALDIDTDWLNATPRRNNTTHGHGHGHGKCEDPIVLVSRWGDQIIATLVLRVVKRERKAYVRAWTVDCAFRKRGVGSALLEEAVRVAWGKGARCVVFDEGHANSHRVLPESFGGVFDELEAKARMLLAATVAEVRREKSSR